MGFPNRVPLYYFTYFNMCCKKHETKIKKQLKNAGLVKTPDYYILLILVFLSTIVTLSSHSSVVSLHSVDVTELNNSIVSIRIKIISSHDSICSAGLTTRLTRLQPRAPDFLGAPKRPIPVKASMSFALFVKSVKS